MSARTATLATIHAAPLACVATLILYLGGPVYAQDPHDRVIRDLMSQAGIPGVQAAVVTPARIIWEKGYGAAVLDVPGPRKSMQRDTLLGTASMGKLLVTVAALQLVEQGRIHLDDDINTSLPFALRNPGWPDVAISWRMLLTHTSSLADDESQTLESDYVYGHDATATLEEVVGKKISPSGGPSPHDLFRPGKPGTERIYSNLAFDTLALAMQSVVGEPFHRYVTRVVLKPLGMLDTGYWLTGRPAERFGVGYVSLQNKDHSFRYEPAAAFWAHRDPRLPILDHAFTCPNYASGCLYSTAHDFALLMQMFLNDGSIKGTRVLKADTVKLMASPSGFRNLDGWMQGVGMNGPLNLLGEQLWGHDGIDRGVATVFYFNPKTHIGVVAMANANNPEYTLSYSLLDIGMHLMSRFESR